MRRNTTAGTNTSQAEFWMADRDQYLVDAATRNETGRLHYPVPEANANRWVIVREMYDDADPHELPTPILVGEFEDRAVAEHLRELILATAERRPL